MSKSIEIREEAMSSFMRTFGFAYTWVISDFSVWLARAEWEQSSFLFPSGQDEKIQWVLSFRPESAMDKRYCSLFLVLASSVEIDDKLDVKFEITLTDLNDKTFEQESMSRDYGWKAGWGWHNFIKRGTLLKKVSSGDKLFIRCKVQVNAEIVNETLPGNFKQLPETLPSSLSKDLNNLVEEEKYGDVTILIDGQRFLAYKGILAARSAVFAAMFDHQMQESLENCVTISNIDPKVFKELLRYTYTDELPAVNTMAHELYAAADKYSLRTLKSLCRYYILQKLNWETAVEALVLAEMHSDQEMKKHALRNLSGSEAEKVTESGGWKRMVRSHPNLVDETVKALVVGKTVGAKK